MAGERIYGGSTNMNTVLHNEGISCSSSSAFEPLFISNSTSPSLLGSRSMVNFEGVHGGKKSSKSFYRRLDEEENCKEDLGEGCYHTGKKRRLTTNQVEFLERSFEIENKLEPERKVQLARDLGLHQRQIAIWFQNRRARWKTKQLEKDYEILKASCTSLQADYDNLFKEKEKLKSEVVILKEKLLLKDKKSENSEWLEPNKPSHPQLQNHILNSNSVEQESNIVQVFACKQEALSSNNSDILDSDNPHYIDADGVQSSRFEPAVSSHVFELDDSTTDLSQDEDENLSKRFFPPVYQVPKLEEDYDDTHLYQPENSCSYGLGAGEDQPLWFWS